MKALTSDAILACTALRTERVEIPEWGGFVMVRELTGDERDHYESELAKAFRDGRALQPRALLCAMSVVGETGERLFTHETHVARLGKKSGRALDRIADVAERLSGIGKGAEAAQGNSAGARGDAPSSESPSPSDAGPATSSPS